MRLTISFLTASLFSSNSGCWIISLTFLDCDGWSAWSFSVDHNPALIDNGVFDISTLNLKKEILFALFSLHYFQIQVKKFSPF